jgi:DNA-binding response OmpR family regulator
VLVVRPGSPEWALPANSAFGHGTHTILVVVDSEAERERILSLLASYDAAADGCSPSRALNARPSHAVQQAHAECPATHVRQPVLHVEELSVDRDKRIVSVGDQVIRSITALEFRLLCTLLERAEYVQTRAALLRDVWGISGSTATRTVDVHIKRLRDKLGSASRFIECTRGVGYRFNQTPITSEV